MFKLFIKSLKSKRNIIFKYNKLSSLVLLKSQDDFLMLNFISHIYNKIFKIINYLTIFHLLLFLQLKLH